MKTVTVSTCGTSILTNGTHEDDVKFLRSNANKRQSEYNLEDIAIISNIVNEKSKLLVDSEPKDVQRLSAELNGFISFYTHEKRFDAEEAGNHENIHYLIHTDTFQGSKTAEIIQAWGQAHNINMQLVQIDDLNTSSVEEFRIGANNLIEWCAQSLPGYREQGYRVIFNLVGGFKSLQGYMQTLGMFYADEIIYIFETGGELLRIPKLPVDFDTNAKQYVLDHFNTFRRMQFVCLPVNECAGIPETLLEIMDDKCTLSVWGRIIWEDTLRDKYGAGVVEPLSERIIITDKVKDKINDLERNRRVMFNKQIDELSRYIDSGSKNNLNSVNLRQLTKSPIPPSTHEFNLWPDMGGWRGFCHWDENNNLIVDNAGMGLNHNKH